MKHIIPFEKQLERVDQRFQKSLEHANRSFYNKVHPKGKADEMLIGINALNNQPVFLPEKDRAMHVHTIGTTGAGKSKLMEHMIRSDIDQGRGLCLVDPHRDLYKKCLNYVVRKGLDDGVILIDPNDEEWAVGINHLEYDPGLRSSASHASEVMKGIAKVFGGEDTDIMPRLQRWERNGLTPLIERELTLVELARFVDPDVSYLREIILREVKNPDILDEWERFKNAPRRDKESYVEAVFNRANKFTSSDTIKRMFGQVRSTIDFRKAMDESKIILCNLGCDKISQEEQKMLGIVIIDKIIQAGKSRMNIPERDRRPFYVYLDEFGLYVSEDIAKALQELRKFDVRFILSHQELEQLRENDRKIYSAVMSEPQVRISFRISREDAEILAKEMFTGKIRGDQEKRRIEQTKFRPVETTRTIRTESESWAEADFESEAGIGLSLTGSTRGLSSSYGGGFSQSTVPFYEYEPFKEVSNVTDYSVEEVVEKFIAWIKTQEDRHAQLKVRQQAPLPIITPFVGPCPVREKDIQAFKEKIYSRYALPAREVDQMIEARRKKFLEEAEASGLVEAKKPIPELTPESMRHKLPPLNQSQILTQDINPGRYANGRSEKTAHKDETDDS